MTPEAWFVVAVVGVVFVLLAMPRMPPDLALVGGVVVLFITGVLTAEEALGGLANEGMITVGVLFIVSAGVTETGAVGWLANRLFGRPTGALNAMIRMSTPAAALSAFMNNTPLVAMLIPAVNDWAKQHRISPSKLMIPLSYAAILGGTCTLIGTSTNLVVNGMLIKEYDQQVAEKKAAGEPQEIKLPRGLGMFDISWVGVPAAVSGLAFMFLTSRWLLPNRMPPLQQLADPREYTIEMMVQAESPLVSKTIEGAGLRHLPGLFLAEIERDGEIMAAVGPEVKLKANDRLLFVGVVDSINDLTKLRGLVPATNQVFKLDSHRSQRCLIEAVVGNRCPLVGKTIRAGGFRSTYNAVVIAVSRQGERIGGKIGDIELETGDTLLLEAHPDFVERHRNSREFFLVSRLEDSTPPRHDKAWIALAILLTMVVAVTLCENFFKQTTIDLGIGSIELGKSTMLKASMIAAGLMIVTRCCRMGDARNSIDWSVLLSIAASFALGKALEKTHAAGAIAEAMTGAAGGSAWWSLAAIYGVTLIVTELITNNAAAALMFPFAIATASSLQANPIPFIVCVMMAASAGFATPIGYQTNLMVYGPGGYKFSDYVKLGVPMDILIWVVTVAIAPFVWPF